MKRFNIFDFIVLVKENKKKYFWTIGVVAVLVAVKVFLQHNYYTSTTTLAPEFSSGLSSSSQLGNLASLAGVNLNALSGSDEDAIHIGIYAEVVGSTDFLQDLLQMEVETSDAEYKGSLKNYLTEYNTPLFQIPSLFGKKDNADNPHADNKAFISEDDMAVINSLGDDIVVKQDNTTGLLVISVTMEDPYIAMCVADSVSEKLQRYIYSYRTKKANVDLAYAEKLLKESNEEYVKASDEYSKYADSHQGLFLAEYKTREIFLENEMNLKYQVYNQAMQQVTMAKAKIQSRTPVYNVVQPAIVPVKKTGPRRIVSILMSCVVAFCVLSLYLFLRSQMKKNE